jgi:hypothetical protein
LALLPIYWLFWRKASEANRVARTVLTSLIAVAVWWSFLTGHIIRRCRGIQSSLTCGLPVQIARRIS